MSNFKLRIEIPDVTASDIFSLMEGKVTAINRDGYIECMLPWIEGCSELVVRQTNFPLQLNDEAIYVRNLMDIKNVISVLPGGGIARLIRGFESGEILTNIENRLSKIRERLLKEKSVFVFAAHRNAAKCVHYCETLGLNIAGFIDNDTKKHGQKYFGKEILPLARVDKNAVIINASGRYCVEIEEQLDLAGYQTKMNLMEFLFLFDLPFQAQKDFRAYISEVAHNRLKIVSLYLMLEDKLSRDVMDNLVLYRLTLNSKTVGQIASPYDEEFFAKDLLVFSKNEVFVDGGAYDGDSFLRFSRMAAGFSRAYLFEPDEEICKKAEQAVGGDDRVMVCNTGLYSKTGELRFSSTGGMDGAISESGEERIKVVALDDFVDVPITHIKLDVEGAEEAALLGAKNHIHQDRPKMAIAAYHKAGDLWGIPALIESLGGEYRFTIRHYSQTIDDSIFYALPKAVNYAN
jgi:FkbM family methyltransferase